MLQNKEEHMVESRFSLPRVNAAEKKTAGTSVDERRNVFSSGQGRLNPYLY